MTSTSTGQYVLESEMKGLQREFAELLNTAGTYFGMVERGEMTAAEARMALEAIAKLGGAL